MVTENGVGFPKFPTQFVEEDVERLRELEEQRKALAEAYKVKFSKEAWAGVPPLEKAVRRITPPWLAPVVEVFPGTAETLEFGFTPEQFQEQSREIEEEYKELARKQRVTSLLPSIQSDILMAALLGEPIADISDLLSTFPELRTDFTEEEINYLARVSQTLLNATPEQIMSGELFAYEPSQLPITEEDVESFFPKGAVDPRFVFASVSFAKDLEEISMALRQAYPPQVGVEVEEELRQKLLDYFKQKNIELGITVEGKTNKELIQELHQKVAEDAGESLILISEEGDIISARRDSLDRVWVGEDLIGFYNEDNKEVVPISLFTGEPLLTEQEQESSLKDLWDAFYLGVHQAWYGTKQGIRLALLEAVTPKTIKGVVGERIVELQAGVEGFPGQRGLFKGLQELLIQSYERNELQFQEWVKEHPEMLPRPEYLQNPLEHPELFRDPYYYAYTIISNAPIIGTALLVSIGTTVATKNPWAGAVAGAAILTPVQINSVYEDLVANGADPRNAVGLATSVGTLIGAVEILPGMLVLKAVSPIFMRTFGRNLQREVVKQLVVKLSIKGILKTATKIEIAETLEEVIQQAMQNAIVKTVNENRSIIEGLDQAAIQAAIAVLPLAAFGGGAEYLNMRANLPPQVNQEIDETSSKMQEAGLAKEHADAVAVAQVLETETGQAQVEEAVEKSSEQAPITSDKITKMETRLTSYNEEITVVESSIEAQKARLEKMKVAGELPSEQLAQLSIIKDLEESLIELEKNKKAVLVKIKKARKELTKEPVTPAVPEVIPELVADLRQGAEYEGRFFFGSYSHERLIMARDVPDAPIHKIIASARENYNALRVKHGLKPITDWTKRPSETLEQRLREVTAKLPAVEAKVEPSLEPGIVETPQAEAVDSVTAPQQIIAPYLITDPLVHKRRPRTIEWELEQEAVEETLENPSIAKHIQVPKGIKATRTNAETVLNRLQDGYQEAKEAKDKDAIKVAEDRLKAVAKEAGLKAKALLGKRWDDLPPDDKMRLAVSLIPDKSLKFHAAREGFDMEYFMEFLEEMTGVPFYSILRRIEAANAATETEKEIILQRITTDPHFKDIRSNEEALARVAQEINARNEVQGVEHPDGLTENELLLADAIEDVYNSYKPVVRYLRVMRTKSTMEDFRAEFPDAVEAGKELELELALKLKEEGNLDDLWAYLFPLDWGVIEHGFDPRLISSPGLKIRRRGGLKVTRGKGRLMRRESVEYPAGKMGMNVLARLGSFIEQLEIQWRIEPDVDTLSDYWEMVGDKFEDWGQIERGLETWLERVQNVGLGYNWFDRQVRKLWRQAMASVFLEPFMAFRNSFQATLFHPDRTELFRLPLQQLPASLSEKGKLYFDTFVSQLGGLRRDWLHVGERGFLIPEWWNRMADSFSLYGKSDYYPRLWSFKAALNKARRATEQYTKDKNFNKWVKASGAIHLRVIERNYALSHYLGQMDKTFNLDVPGLHEVKGSDMANFYVAQRVADITHFKYRRSSRGIIEMGKTGTTLWNLIVFTRGYAQRLYFQGEKIKRAFDGEATWNEARTGFNDIMKLVVVSLLFDELFKVMSGRRYNPYFVMNILFGWQFGGLFVGIAQDMTIAISDIAAIINPFEEEERKNIALTRMPQAIERLGDTLIPFYRRAWDIAEASLGTQHLDRESLRKARAIWDKDYTPGELDEMDRNLWEKIRKGLLGGEIQDPTKLQIAMENIEEAGTRLGTLDVTGRYYTVGNFGGEVSSLLKAIPNILITEQEGFSPLVLFYKDCEEQWAELTALPSKKRNDWRKEHILEEAMLLFWEKYRSSVFILGSPEAEEVKALLQMWFDLYGIDRTMHGEWTSWALPAEIPPPEE